MVEVIRLGKENCLKNIGRYYIAKEPVFYVTTLFQNKYQNQVPSIDFGKTLDFLFTMGLLLKMFLKPLWVGKIHGLGFYATHSVRIWWFRNKFSLFQLKPRRSSPPNATTLDSRMKKSHVSALLPLRRSKFTRANLT